jgi:Putative Ig domain/Bacterial Ig domain
MRGRCLQLLRCLGLLMGLLCILAGCGGNSGSSDTSGTVSRSRSLSLQVQVSSALAPQAVPIAQSQGLVAAAGRQVQPGDPGFIERIVIRLQAQGSDLVLPQVFTLDPTEQEIVTLEVTVPDTAPTTFQVLVSCFNPQGIEVFHGDTSVALGQTSAVVTLVRTALVPVPATPANLQQTTFLFADGAIFGLANIPVTLVTGTFVDNVGDFALTASGLVASGSVTIGSCTFVVTTSTFPPGQGLQVGDRLVLDPCQIDAIDRRLIVTNGSVGVTATSSPPLIASPDTTLNLPTPPSLVMNEDTSGALQIGTSVSGTRPGIITLGLTIPPAHGTATLTSTGILTYQPMPDFKGPDRLVVTVVVRFADNNPPVLLLGTVPVSITVQPVNDPPVVNNPGNQNTPQETVVSLPIQARDVEDDPLTFSATNLPSGLAINPMTGVISGTIDFTAIVRSPYSVTVTVSDGTASTNTTFTWTITILHDPGTTVVGRVIDAGGKPVAGASVICLGLKGLTGADGTFSLAGVPTVQGNIQCSVNVFTPPGQTLTGTVMGVTPLRGQITNVGDITVTPLALFGTDASGGNLLTINPATGIGTIVGPMRVGSVPALAIDPTTDIMYAATGSGNPNLYMVDPSTGATSLIGSTGLGVAAVSDIAFRADGTLYAAVNIVGDGSTGADNLATINKTF